MTVFNEIVAARRLILAFADGHTAITRCVHALKWLCCPSLPTLTLTGVCQIAMCTTVDAPSTTSSGLQGT